MYDFRFANPEYLFLLAALPVIWVILGRVDSRARQKLQKFMAEANLKQLLLSRGTLRERGKRAAFWLGMALMILAVARPQANPIVEEVPSSGLDIYILLDVSRSMDAEDVAPSRLKKAKRTIQHLTSRLSGDRVGIIAFANSAVLVTPLTSDYAIVESYLKNVDSSLVPSQGTNVGGALMLAKEAMERGAKAAGGAADRSNIFIVLSDGEDHGVSDLSIVEAIHKAGGLIFSIALGTEKGVPIPVRNEKGELLPNSYRKDSQDNIVITAVKPAVLEEIAKRGGGHFYFSTVDEGEVEDILARVSDAQRGSYTAIKTTVYEELFWVFLAPAILILLFSFVPLWSIFFQGRGQPFSSPRWLSKIRGRTSMMLILFLALPHTASAHPLSFLWSKEKKASEQSSELAKEKKFAEAVDSLKGLQAENPDSPELNYNIGTYFLQDKRGRQGREQLTRLRSADGPLRDLALFNSAGSFALEGKKEEARATYAELLHHLARKTKLNDAESLLLEQTKRNVARLADPNQQPPPQQDKSESQQQQGKGGQEKKDQKDKQDQDKQPENKGDQGKNKGDGDKGKQPENKGEQDKNKGAGDEKKDQDQKGEQEQEKGDQDKDKQDQKGDQGKDQGKQQSQRGPQPFKDRDNMGEEEAKRILGALKERESALQKNFLKKKSKGGKVNVDDAAKDW